MFHHTILRWATATLLVAICLCPFVALAQETPRKEPQPGKDRSRDQPRGGNISDPRDLEAFFDGVLNVQLQSKHIAGAVVAVVVGDKVVFSKGYGYADVEARRKVDPEKTMFRIASISKLFTWTAVMQLVEDGKLDLDTDINTYLKDVQVPAGFDKPITLTHLLTHTPGFDDVVLGLFARKPEEVGPLAEVLKTQMPTRVRPPGVLSSYSNHGTALAGHVVACVSGMPWEEYVEKRILKPLGMKNTLTRQPALDDLPAGMSKGYKWEGGKFKEQDFEYVPAAPAGCMSTTAADAAKFMLAHLHDGKGDNGRILKPQTARQMREPLFRHNPNTSAMCYGFMEQRRHGLRIVGHGGDTIWFHSLMELIPERQVGLFVSYNTQSSAGQREPLFDAFLRRYFPPPDVPRIEAREDFRERAGRLAGEYGITRYSHTSVTKLSSLLGVVKVSVNDDDTLTISLGDMVGQYVEVEPFVFREVNGPRKFVFQEEDGQVRYLFLADFAPISAIRHKWYERSAVHWGLLAGSVGILVSAFLFWPVIGFSVRGLVGTHIKRTRFSGVLSVLGWILSVVGIVFAAGVLWALRDSNVIVFGLTPLLKGLLVLTPIFAGLTVLTVVGCVLAWKRRYWRLTGRLHYTLVALAGIGFTCFLYYWNLLTLGPLT
jgi:CubicO group peptidase (beta-lactamase class C family)